MSKKMLIDACHAEETRVVVLSDNQIDEFDFESTHKKQLKGNIYLAKVTRIEPSLQAAFVEYGGNRHGFLAFSDIHPDYYQIPHVDKLKALEFEAIDTESEETPIEDSDSTVDILDDSDDTADIIKSTNFAIKKKYQIHEVIKKNQILLVQIVKEERGTKGAAVTTYLSLAGRYSVLMPNTPRGGGISRKVTNIKSRTHLKTIVKSLDIPKGMGVILRTAGANRTKIEIKRDYEYLLRLWETIRSTTLKSRAPCLIHEEASLIKRSIRDLYNKEIEQILIGGDQAYREAKDFMRMLIPSHAKVVQPYKEEIPLFSKYNIEQQLDNMLQPIVKLKSGGYIVIEQTEALVSIDVNSGRATKESNVEKTALQTNSEAAEEVARQLRLRDLSGLVIIDFIDMEDKRNIRQIENILRNCLKNDRAKIQVGRISPFGLVEMSRQRIRSSVLESTTQICKTCKGIGYLRSSISVAIYALRMLEAHLLKDSSYNLRLKTSPEYALSIFNRKKNQLMDLEKRFNVTIEIEAVTPTPEKLVHIERSTTALKIQEDLLSKPVASKTISEHKIEDNKQEEVKEAPVEPKKKRSNRKKPAEPNIEIQPVEIAPIQESNDEPVTEKLPKKEEKTTRRRKKSKPSVNENVKEISSDTEAVATEDTTYLAVEEPKEAVVEDKNKPAKPRRTGWWQRKKELKTE